LEGVDLSEPTGTIVVKKDAVPDDPQDFDFTAGGGLTPASFTLDDDSDSTLSNTQTFGNVPPGSGYSITEATTTGWDQQSATCDDGSPPSAIDVSAGETVTCTFTNTKIHGYARPKAATPTSVALVPAYEECLDEGSNASHGAPLAVPACNPPVPSSDYLTVGSPDANGNPAGSAGKLNLKAVGENPIDPDNGDQSDVEITASFTDVRNSSDLMDYTGELRAVVSLRMTDRHNGAALQSAATVQDAPFAFNLACSETTGPQGGTCNVATTADAVTPDIAREGKRAIWELGQVQVFDGGDDGDADTAGDNTLFAVQGLFTP
jgi:hypothetical protein